MGADDPKGDPRVRRIAKDVLAGKGTVPWKTLLTSLFDVSTLRELTRELGLSPKGFRVDRAPASVLVPLLVEVQDAAKVDKIVGALVRQLDAFPPAAGSESEASESTETALLRLRDQEKARLADKLAKAEQGNAALRARIGELDRAFAGEREAAIRARVERDRLAAELEGLVEATSAQPDAKEATKQLVELKRDRTALWDTCENYRRMLAAQESQIRDLQGQVEELESLIPVSRRRKKKPMAELPPPDKRFLVPHFQPGFYRSLDGKDRRSVERAVQAVFTLCTEGPSYPGLEAKQLGGSDLWSVRAGIKLRIYFEMRGDGDVELVAVADREDQPTMLKRLKSRGDGA